MAAKKKTKSSRTKKTKSSRTKKTKSSRTKKTKTKSKSKSKKKAFGGYAIRFAGRKETLEQVFGKKPIGPSEMTKKIWKFVKSKKLGHS